VSQPPPAPTVQHDPEKVARVQQALRDKAERPCARCDTDLWQLDFVGIPVVPLGKQQSSFPIPPPHIPALVLTCSHCGNAVIHHLGLLGVEP
jgi:hypothetical protein